MPDRAPGAAVAGRAAPQVLLAVILLCTALPGAAEVLRRGLGAEPDSLDIHQAQGLPALQVLRDLGEGLFTLDAEGRPAPGVAERWQVEDGGRRYRFTLRSDARWSDGEPVLAVDFLRAWRQALAPATQARTAALLLPLRGAGAVMAGAAQPAELGVTATSARELVVELESPTPWLPELLSHPVSFPLPARAAATVRERPVNGAYRIVEVAPRSHVRLERNPAFHAAASVAVETLEWLPIEDPGTELARYRAGELDITETIPPGRYRWLRDNLGDELRIAPYLGSFWLGYNFRHPELGRSRDLRQALALAVDRETLVRVVLGAGEGPAWSVVPPGMDGYVNQQAPGAQLTRAERESRARGLYRQAGFGPARPLRVQIRYNTSATHRRMAVAVAAMWKQVLGVHAELIHEEWKVFVNNRRLGVLTEVFRGGWIADYADPVSFLDLFRSDAALNATFYANPEYDRLLDRATMLDGAERLAQLQQAEALLLRDMPVIPLYHYVSRHLVKPRVRGFRDNLRDAHPSRYLSIDPGPP